MMKCLVTGASGFIGNALVQRLINENNQVIGLIHDHSPPSKNPNATYIVDDITQPGESLRKACKEVDIVFHCAAYVKDYGPKKLFYDINVEGTKNLVHLCNRSINRFIHISHIPYDEEIRSNYYTKTKTIAESFLLDQYKKNGFPVIIIRPGNVYGPGATTWVLRPLESIKNNRITLVNHGSGIFLHTYIDNLLDALMLAAYTENILGKTFNITDGDYSITWGRYFNDLALMIDKAPLKRNLSKSMATVIGKIMLFFYHVIGTNPWVTPQAVETLTNTKKVSIKEAENSLGYSPRISYKEGMKRVEKWLKEKNLID